MQTHDLKRLLIQTMRSPKWLAAQSGYAMSTIYGILSPNAKHPSKIPRTIDKLGEILMRELEAQSDPLAIRDDVEVVVASEFDKDQSIQKINENAK